MPRLVPTLLLPLGLVAGEALVGGTGGGGATGAAVVAVFDVEVRHGKVPAARIDALTALLVAELARSRRYRVVPRAEVRRRLRAQKRASYGRCYAQRCQIAIGRELAATKSVSTQVLGLGGGRCLVVATVQSYTESH